MGIASPVEARSQHQRRSGKKYQSRFICSGLHG
jgi:hypothetical protein